MKRAYTLQLILALVGCLEAFAQNYPESPGCLEPYATKIEEFTFEGQSELTAKMSSFREELETRGSYHQGVVHLYGGRASRSDEVANLVKKIETIMGLDSKELWIRPGGYRNLPTVEFYILPMQCTQYPPVAADLRIDEIEIVDLPSKRLQRSEITRNIVEEPEAKCSPAARAVRACDEGTEVEVFVVINDKGRVVFSESLLGHPLNRATAAAAAKQFIFKPFVDGGETIQVSGTIKVFYRKPEEVINSH